jgi:hypothetical protein
LVSDFQTFELYDLEDNARVRFTLRQFPEHVEDFGFVLGVRKRTFREQDPFLIWTITQGVERWVLSVVSMSSSRKLIGEGTPTLNIQPAGLPALPANPGGESSV